MRLSEASTIYQQELERYRCLSAAIAESPSGPCPYCDGSGMRDHAHTQEQLDEDLEKAKLEMWNAWWAHGTERADG